MESVESSSSSNKRIKVCVTWWANVNNFLLFNDLNWICGDVARVSFDCFRLKLACARK